jgi:hypothetical protein
MFCLGTGVTQTAVYTRNCSLTHTHRQRRRADALVTLSPADAVYPQARLHPVPTLYRDSSLSVQDGPESLISTDFANIRRQIS